MRTYEIEFENGKATVHASSYQEHEGVLIFISGGEQVARFEGWKGVTEI